MFFNERIHFPQKYRVELFLLISALLHLIIFLLLSGSSTEFQPKPQPKDTNRDMTRILLQNPNPKEQPQEPPKARYLASTAHKTPKETRR
jgi:hypothetical protein